jgi:tetratricopeptide (TPR) repeat protein/SAM-dependent methyltransferase
MSKPGRNEPCSCGSGRKFKQCCISRGENSAANTREVRGVNVGLLVRQGLEGHQAGRLAEAERCYRQALEADPSNIDALHFLGVLAHQIKRHAQGAELIERSILLDASNPIAHNNLGEAYRAMGRFDDAVASYQKALTLQSDLHEVRNNLGESYRAMGHLEEAAQCLRDVVSRQPDYAVAHNNLGLVLQNSGELDAALDCFAKALALCVDYWNAHNNMGETLRMLGRNDEALAAYQQALALNPDFAEAHNNRGLVLRQQGEPIDAQAAFERAIALRPDLAEVHNNLGILLREQGKIREAIDYFECAVKLKPDLVDAHLSLAGSYKDLGYTAQALLCCQAALRAMPTEASFWVLFSEIVRLLPADAIDRVDFPMLLAALKKDEVDPQKIERIAVAFLFRSFPVLAASKDREIIDWAEFCSDENLLAFIRAPLLLAVLEEALVTDFRLECMLLKIRRILLKAVANSETFIFEPAVERFTASLAQQCFANEYIFAISTEEEFLLGTLNKRIDDELNLRETCPDLWLMLAGAYQDMHSLGFANRIRLENRRDGHFWQVLVRQLIEPCCEVELRNDIPRLTPVENQVSRAVQRQYEESPYPRWRKLGRTGKGQPIVAFLRNLFPKQELLREHSRDFLRSGLISAQTHLDVLVAGCGTGYHAIQAAQRFDRAHVLAVDLSLGSLAYAKRSTKALGIGNIDYQLADILQLANLDRQFDVIESCGVLHHMADPKQGWRILVDLLRPGGYMFIGLYSERARRQVSALRKLIAERGYEATPDGIRRFRADAMSGTHDISLAELARSPDFNSTSACRDLLFHVQEHLFTPIRIQASLEQLGLKFLGFELPYPEVTRNYLVRFPENQACDSLENWEKFEQDNPHVFSGMYQFWVKKEGVKPEPVSLLSL